MNKEGHFGVVKQTSKPINKNVVSFSERVSYDNLNP